MNNLDYLVVNGFAGDSIVAAFLLYGDAVTFCDTLNAMFQEGCKPRYEVIIKGI